jgi:hypothetical protein
MQRVLSSSLGEYCLGQAGRQPRLAEEHGEGLTAVMSQHGLPYAPIRLLSYRRLAAGLFSPRHLPAGVQVPARRQRTLLTKSSAWPASLA